MKKDKIIEEIYKDEFYKCYIGSLCPELVEEAYSEFLLSVCEVCDTKLSMLHETGALKYYFIGVIRNILVNKYSDFNKYHRTNTVNIDDFYNLAIDETKQVDSELVKELMNDVYSFLEGRTKRVEGAWYDERLFKMYFGKDETFRSLSDKTSIHYSSIFQSVKGTQEIIKTKFKKRYDDL